MSFERIARHYRWLEAVLAGGVLQRARTGFLQETLHARSALLIGEANGRFLAPFLKTNPTARVVVVEQSARMIACAQRSLIRQKIAADRVEFIQGNALDWIAPEGQFDLIVTHFFLDCFTGPQLQRLVPRLASAGKRECIWLLADFQIPPAGPARWRAQLIHQLMYAFFRVTTNLPARRLTPPDEFLRGAGFQRTARVTMQWDLIHSDCWRRGES